MCTYFDSLFYKYCNLKTSKRKNTILNKLGEEIISLAAVTVLFLAGTILILYQCGSFVPMAIGYIILLCSLTIFARGFMSHKSEPSIAQYSEHIDEVVKILKDHQIAPDNFEKLNELIEYSTSIMERRNPLSDIKKALTFAGSAIAVIWSILANGLNSYANLSEFIAGLLLIAACVIACCLMLVVIYNVIVFLLFPQKKKYQQLIDDLTQISIFYSTTQSH